MYTKDKLIKYEYFNNLLQKYNLDHILDPLTKTIIRKYIIRFIEALINEKTPFAMAIMDIDNFKNINDNYGHRVGDVVLTKCADNLLKYVGDDGLVGRYGGDEFIIIYFKDITYDGVHEFLLHMYDGHTVLQRNMCIEDDVSPFLTATIGSTSYPLDATDYDALFLNADKALYRGKRKGRNCFIVYVESKHKDIQIENIIKEPVYCTYEYIYNIINDGKQDKKERIFDEINARIENSEIVYINKDLLAYHNKKRYHINSSFNNLLDIYGLFESSSPSTIKNEDFKNFCADLDFESVLMCKVGSSGKKSGYLVIGCKNIQRLWQDEEKALLSYVCKIIDDKGIL